MNNLSIDYVMMCHNDLKVAEKVVLWLDTMTKIKDAQDQLWLLDDYSDKKFLKMYKHYPVKIVQHRLEKDYSAHRNSLIRHLKSDYAFYIDSDETLAPYLISNLKDITLRYNYPDVVLIPRKNIVKGVKPINALHYGWTLDLDTEVIQWLNGDFQSRYFRVKSGVKWVRPVHEGLIVQPHHKVLRLDKNENLAIIHTKTIEEQIANNNKYNSNWSKEDNIAGGSYDGR